MRAVVLPFCLAVLGQLSTATFVVSQEPLSGAAGEVWAMEEAYWQRVGAGDVEGYLDLWDESFMGWPCTAESTYRKGAIAGWMAGVRDGRYEISYELERHGVQLFDDVAVAYYTTPIVYTYPDGHREGTNERWKFVHTWRRDGDTWRILGGMCGLYEWGPGD